ncbi:MAG: formylglycine-generating enzyme family protein [Nitrospira sp.]|nr:formylglycine-generating enzyme family protein [Nitrospira sp.]
MIKRTNRYKILPQYVIYCALLLSFLGGASYRVAHASTPQPPFNGMVYIPAGPFLMGSVQPAGLAMLEAGVDEFPQQKVVLKAFWIDQYEVTVEQYKQFAEATGHRAPPIWTDPAYSSLLPSHPVIDVSWDDAEAYCKWSGKRLPTEAEWEKAARGTDGRIWPWGNTFDSAKANTMDSGKGWTVSVGSLEGDISPYGVHDMAGNAMEWTASWYKAYPGNTLQRVAFGEKYRVMKGGAWNNSALPFSRAANRHAVAPKWDHPNHGFRCAKDV